MRDSSLTFHDLVEADLSALGTAVGDWNAARSDLKDLSTEADRGMRTKSDAARWTGVNAGFGKRFVRKIAAEVEDLHLEAKTIWTLLDGAHADLTRIQEKLKTQREKAERHKIRIQDNGDGTVTCEFRDVAGTFGPIPGATAVQQTQHTAEQSRTRNDIQSAINTLVAEARVVDQSAGHALRKAHGNDPHNAGHATYKSLDDAQAEQATSYARKQLRLYKTGKELPTHDLESLAALTKHNANDPEFATTFYRALGPKNALLLHAQLGIDASTDGGEHRMELARVVQNSMGTGLATATHDPLASPVPTKGDATHLGSDWVAAMKRAGRSEISLGRLGGAQKTLGYQVLGNVLRHGEYDSGFLNDVGKDMVTYDRKHGGAYAWPTATDPAHEGAILNLDRKGGAGYDPMTGLMEAFGHSPDAATDFFNYSTGSGESGDFRKMSNLDYLLGTGADGKGEGARQWLPDPLDNKQYGKDALGRALEAGTTGLPAGETIPGVRHNHTAEQGRVMQHVIESVSKNSHVTDKHIADSFGRMAADYMPEINQAFRQDANAYKHIYQIPAGVPELDAHKTAKFLDALARHPDGYAEATLGAQLHQVEFTKELNENSENYKGTPAENIQRVAYNTGSVEGILSGARHDSIVASGQLKEDNYNEALAERGEHIKSTASETIGLFTERVPVAGQLSTALTDKIIDSIVESHEKNTTEEVANAAGEKSFKALGQAKEAAAKALSEAGNVPGVDQTDLHGKVSEEVESGFDNGMGKQKMTYDNYDRRQSER